MHIHFDGDIFWDDLVAFVDGFATAIVGHDRHKQLSKRLLDPNCSDHKSAKITIVANCANCGLDLLRDIETVWKNGSPVKFSLIDETCPDPNCRGKKGFHYVRTKSLHA